MTAYTVHGPLGDPPMIEACSIGARLPFQSRRKGPVVAGMRAELEAALRKLTATGDEILHATLLSPLLVGENPPDTESVLLLNVECAAAFGPTCHHGLRFERVYERPMAATLPGAEHQHLYTVAPLNMGFRRWRAGGALASLTWTELPSWSETRTFVSELWWRLRQASVELHRLEPLQAGPVCLELELEASQTNASRIVKKLIDAVISAFQFQAGPLDPRVAPALSAQIGEPSESVASTLAATDRGVLGGANLVVFRRPAVQWLPSDDRVVAFELKLRPGQTSTWRMRGRISAAEARP